MKTDYTEDNLRDIIKNSFSLSDVCKSLGLIPKGSNFNTVKKYIKMYNIDVSHFTGSGWRKNKSINEISAIDLSDILKDNISYKSSRLKRRLIDAGKKMDICEVCGISDWNNKPIVFELHHINGDHYDNRLENLQVVCPNCHSQTDNYRNRNKKRYVDDIPTLTQDIPAGYNKVCPVCGKSFVADRDIRVFCSRDCYNKSLSNNKIAINEDILLSFINDKLNISEMANKLNVSRPTIKKYLERYGLLDIAKEQYDYHAKPVVQYTLDGEFVKEWGSIDDAEEHLNVTGIGRVANLQRKSAGGFVWRYKE